jgi:hypothetical protein
MTSAKSSENKGIDDPSQNSAEIMARMDFDKNASGNKTLPIINIIDKMDELLTKDQRFANMELQGCCKSGQRDKDTEAFAKEHAGLPLSEKLKLLANVQYMMTPHLDDDGTISVTWSGYQNGVHKGATTCSCGAIKKLRQPFSVSSTYCGCCAGHFLYHYQNALGIKLRLKDNVSPPLNTNGEKPCSFVFEILQ